MLYWYILIGIVFFIVPFFVYGTPNSLAAGKEVIICSIVLAVAWPIFAMSFILSAFIFFLLMVAD